MKVTIWGAAQTVTGSMHLVELDNGTRLLLDCGLYQGRRKDAHRINSELPYDAGSIDAVLLSHAHIDHSGLLPLLYKQGFRGRIWATHATYDLCAVMLHDSAYIQEKDAEYMTRRNRKRGKEAPPIEPLYTEGDAEGALELFVGVGYRQSFEPARGVTVEYRDAGHILGSATMVLEVTEDGKTKRLGFTGDVGRSDRPILRDPQAMGDCDVLISESTYGGKVHEPPEQSKSRLEEIVTDTSRRGGKVIIPAFAVGRTQEIVYILDQLAKEERLPRIPVFVDSPMAVNATEVYRLHPECYDRELRHYLMSDDDPFGFDQLEYVREASRSKAINGMRVPVVVISASGMCEAGRIRHHLKNNIGDSRNTIMMVGYCADHTLGKRLIEKAATVRIFGDPYDVRAKIEVMNSYSAHADEPELLDFIGKIDRKRLKRIVLVHGAPAKQEALKTALASAGYDDVSIPARGDSFTL
jgi:metallo-beta-lactamase family protein